MFKNIELLSYDPNWPHIFDAEATLIKDALQDNFLAIHHIGSTSVPGLAAKAKIDIIAVVKDLHATRTELEKIDMKYRGEYNIPLHYCFSKREKVNINLHVYEESHPEIELNLCFRDYLRAYPKTKEAYALLKLDLLQDESSYIKENTAFTNYTLRKGDFIRSVLKEAGFNRIRILKCNDETEWKVAKDLRNKHFSTLYGMQTHIAGTFHHLDHTHLVLYHGVEIIGYAHIQLWLAHQAAAIICMVAIDRSNQNAEFLTLIEKWLKSLGIKTVYAKSKQSSLQFYLQNGYIEMPFDYPENLRSYTSNISIGKIL
jgi:GrpB-like predicted nucleotidyltransferase (UPF0157 family)